MPSHDRIPDSSRWRTCVHEAGHVALVLLTGTTLKRAVAYRHYSTASTAGAYGQTFRAPSDAGQIRESLIEAAGTVAERIFTDAPVNAILRCTDKLPDDVETLNLCADILGAYAEGVLRVTEVLFKARGSVGGPVLAQAFREQP